MFIKFVVDIKVILDISKMRRYAVIHTTSLTANHIALIRATGVNSYAESLKRTPAGIAPERVIVEWDNLVAQQIPSALAAIQEMIDAGVEIWNEYQMRAYLLDVTNPFYEEAV